MGRPLVEVSNDPVTPGTRQHPTRSPTSRGPGETTGETTGRIEEIDILEIDITRPGV